MALTAYEKTRQTVQVKHAVHLSRYSLEGEIDSIIATLQDIRNRFPAPIYKVTIEIDAGRGYYDSIEVDVNINVSRDETDEEYDARIAKLKQRDLNAQKAARERRKKANEAEYAKYLELKAKYGGSEDNE